MCIILHKNILITYVSLQAKLPQWHMDHFSTTQELVLCQFSHPKCCLWSHSLPDSFLIHVLLWNISFIASTFSPLSHPLLLSHWLSPLVVIWNEANHTGPQLPLFRVRHHSGFVIGHRMKSGSPGLSVDHAGNNAQPSAPTKEEKSTHLPPVSVSTPSQSLHVTLWCLIWLKTMHLPFDENHLCLTRTHNEMKGKVGKYSKENEQNIWKGIKWELILLY